MSEAAPRLRSNGAAPAPLADTVTPILNLVQPEVGASASTWGSKLNSNFAILDNSVQNTGGTINGALTVNGLINVGSTGIQYIGVGGGHSFGFAWAAGFINAFVDGTYIGNLATSQWVQGGGYTIGSLTIGTCNVDGLLSVFGGCNIDGGALVAYGGASITGGCTADTLVSTGNCDVSNDVFAANLIAGAGVYGATVEASVQGYKPGGGVWADSSDERLKRDVRDYETGLRAVCALRPVRYQFNGLGGSIDDGRVYTGLIAQEAQHVMPEMIGARHGQLRPGDPDDAEILTLDATALVYALVNCVKELTERVSVLEAQSR